MHVKAVCAYPLDVGGRLMAPGESGDVDESTPAVRAALDSGDLVEVANPTLTQAAPKARNRKESSE